jgi:hypothetical protein
MVNNKMARKEFELDSVNRKCNVFLLTESGFEYAVQRFSLAKSGRALPEPSNNGLIEQVKREIHALEKVPLLVTLHIKLF